MSTTTETTVPTTPQEPTIPTLSNAIKVVNQTQNNARQLP